MLLCITEKMITFIVFVQLYMYVSMCLLHSLTVRIGSFLHKTGEGVVILRYDFIGFRRLVKTKWLCHVI